MITLSLLWMVTGLMFAAFAVSSLRRGFAGVGNALFWGLLALSLLAGDWLGNFGNGLLVLALVVVGGFNLLAPAAPPRRQEAVAPAPARALFAPLLLLAVVSASGAFFGPSLTIGDAPVFQPGEASILSLGLGAVLALALALRLLKAPLGVALHDGRRIMDDVGWMAVLPLLLMGAGAILMLGGLGELGSRALLHVWGEPGRLMAVVLLCLGMAGLTAVLGNAFLALPLMMAAVGAPFVIRMHGGDPAAVAALAMLAGYSGTLLSPVAVLHSMVPAALLGLPDRLMVIRAQAPTALALLAVNILLMAGFAFG